MHRIKSRKLNKLESSCGLETEEGGSEAQDFDEGNQNTRVCEDRFRAGKGNKV